MKKILLALVFVSGALYAQEAASVNLKKNMQEMETALAVIQRGFLYNDDTLVKGGIKSLQDRVKLIEPPVNKNEELLGGKENTYSHKYAKKEAAKISKLSGEIWKYYERGEKYSAINKYKDTLKQCLACHRKIRKW